MGQSKREISATYFENNELYFFFFTICLVGNGYAMIKTLDRIVWMWILSILEGKKRRDGKYKLLPFVGSKIFNYLF